MPGTVFKTDLVHRFDLPALFPHVVFWAGSSNLWDFLFYGTGGGGSRWKRECLQDERKRGGEEGRNVERGERGREASGLPVFLFCEHPLCTHPSTFWALCSQNTRVAILFTWCRPIWGFHPMQETWRMPENGKNRSRMKLFSAIFLRFLGGAKSIFRPYFFPLWAEVGLYQVKGITTLRDMSPNIRPMFWGCQPKAHRLGSAFDPEQWPLSVWTYAAQHDI